VDTLVGADLLNLRRIQGVGAPIVSIGGAGTFDGIHPGGTTRLTTLQSGATARPVRPTGLSPRPREGTNLGAGAIATGAAVVVYFVAAGIELLLIRTLRPTEVELAWISDAILAFAFGSAVFLWLHLKWTRMTLSRLERERIVLDAQLTLAANISSVACCR
jgi:hypothetical protein